MTLMLQRMPCDFQACVEVEAIKSQPPARTRIWIKSMSVSYEKRSQKLHTGTLSSTGGFLKESEARAYKCAIKE